jgi:hypothetical protein
LGGIQYFFNAELIALGTAREHKLMHLSEGSNRGTNSILHSALSTWGYLVLLESLWMPMLAGPPWGYLGPPLHFGVWEAWATSASCQDPWESVYLWWLNCGSLGICVGWGSLGLPPVHGNHGNLDIYAGWVARNHLGSGVIYTTWCYLGLPQKRIPRDASNKK